MDGLKKHTHNQESLNQISHKDIEKEMWNIFNRDNLFYEIRKYTKKFMNLIENIGINFKLFVLLVSLSIMLILFTIPILPESVNVVYDTTVYNERVDIIEQIPKKISFGEYVLNAEDYDDQFINITGYLKRYRQQKDSSIIINEVLIDDLGNEIILKDIKAYKLFFPDLGVTDSRYQIYGRFERNYNTPNIYIDTITPIEMEYIDVVVGDKIVPKEVVTRREIIEPKKSIIQLLIHLF